MRDVQIISIKMKEVQRTGTQMREVQWEKYNKLAPTLEKYKESDIKFVLQLFCYVTVSTNCGQSAKKEKNNESCIANIHKYHEASTATYLHM